MRIASLFSFLAFLLASIFSGAAAADDLCGRVGAKLGSVTAQGCRERALFPSGHLSVEGASLLARDYPLHPGGKPRGRVLVIGGIHGDEYSSVSIVFRWMEALDRDGAAPFHWRIIPLLNPDGLLRRDSRRGNARNVDLNRNFMPLEGEGSALRYWAERTRRDPRRYPGPYPMSEPETRFAAETIAAFRPDVIVAVHAPYGLVDFDGPPSPPRRLGHLNLDLLGTYPGSLGNYAGVQLGIPVVTVELPSAGRMPSPREVSAIWSDLLSYLDRRLPPAEGTVTAGEPPAEGG